MVNVHNFLHIEHRSNRNLEQKEPKNNLYFELEGKCMISLNGVHFYTVTNVFREKGVYIVF